MKQFEEWEGFKGRIWKEEINTRDFIQENYTPYDGDESFLQDLQKQQISYGVSYRDFRKKNEKKVEFLIWIQTSHLL